MAKSTSTLQFEKDIPLYDGSAELFEEYCERARDAFYGRTGEEKQIATAVNLRSGLSGSAYEAVRHLTHSALLTFDITEVPTPGGKSTIQKKTASTVGLELLLTTLGTAVSKEKPVRAAELFDEILYSSSVRRAPKEFHAGLHHAQGPRL